MTKKKPIRRESVLAALMFAAILDYARLLDDAHARGAQAIARDVRDMLSGESNAWVYARALAGWNRGYTYFMRLDPPVRRGPRPIKIGTSVNPEQRLMSVQVSVPYPVTLLGYVPDILLPERSVQAEFAGYRIRGEWFREQHRLRRLVTQVVAFTTVQAAHLRHTMEAAHDATR